MKLNFSIVIFISFYSKLVNSFISFQANKLIDSSLNVKPNTNKLTIDETFNNIIKSLTIASLVYINKVKPSIAEDKTQLEYMPALQGLDYGKPRTFYPDYLKKPSGLQYKIVKEGTGLIPEKGDRVAIDWEGYTIGYYGRPFQTRNKVKGGAFDSSETDYYRWIVGSGSTIKALDEVITYLPEGSIAQVVVPPELGYPVSGDSDHEIIGPKPNTFSGLRALNFVIENQNLIDKTLLINVKVVRVDKKKNA